MDVHPTKTGINRYWSIPIYVYIYNTIGIHQNITRMYHPRAFAQPLLRFSGDYDGMVQQSDGSYIAKPLGPRNARAMAMAWELWGSNWSLIYCLVVWNMTFSIQLGMKNHPKMTFTPSFFRGVGIPKTSILHNFTMMSHDIWWYYVYH